MEDRRQHLGNEQSVSTGQIYEEVPGVSYHSESTVDATSKKCFTCTLCAKTYLCKFGLVYHHKSVHVVDKEFQCSVCSKKCITQSELSRHLLSHTKEKNFECTFCGWKCSQKGDLKSHFLVPTREKYFSSTECEKKFSFKHHLTRHQNVVHLGLQPYQCDLCPKRFSEQSKLNKHLVTHTKEKVFKCDTCMRCAPKDPRT